MGTGERAWCQEPRKEKQSPRTEMADRPPTFWRLLMKNAAVANPEPRQSKTRPGRNFNSARKNAFVSKRYQVNAIAT